MAIRYVAISASGVPSESLNNQTTLAAAVTTAIDTAASANAAAGAKADVTTEIAAITTALTALTDNQPTGGIVVSVNLATVTSRNKLRQLLDAAYDHFSASSQLT